MLIRKAVLHIKLPITCFQCGATDQSETIPLEFTDTSLEEINDKVKKLRVGHAFPVGWGCYYNLPNDIYRCPNCVSKIPKFKLGE